MHDGAGERRRDRRGASSVASLSRRRWSGAWYAIRGALRLRRPSAGRVDPVGPIRRPTGAARPAVISGTSRERTRLPGSAWLSCEWARLSARTDRGCAPRSRASAHSYRIVPRRYLVAPLGAPTADSRFCGKTEGYTVLYASPDFATAFLETVVRDIPPRPFALLAPRWPSRRMLGPGRVPYSGASTRHRRTGFRFDKPSRVLRRAPLGIGTFSLGDPPVLP